MATAVTHAGLEELQAQLRGDVIAPDHARYEDARNVYNAMIDKHPALIVAVRRRRRRAWPRSTSPASHGLDIAVRGGGHNGAGLGTVDDGLVIDLSPMRGVRVDPGARTAQRRRRLHAGRRRPRDARLRPRDPGRDHLDHRRRRPHRSAAASAT